MQYEMSGESAPFLMFKHRSVLSAPFPLMLGSVLSTSQVLTG